MNGQRVDWRHNKYGLFCIGFIFASVFVGTGIFALLAITSYKSTGTIIGVMVVLLVGCMVCPFVVWKCLSFCRIEETSSNLPASTVDGAPPAPAMPEEKPPPYIDPPSYHEIHV